MFCTDVIAPKFLLFSESVPPLLYYSHIPTAIIVLMIGVFIFLKDKKYLVNKVLFVLSILFSLLTFLNLVAWTNIDVKIITFVWELAQTILMGVVLCSAYLFHVFVFKKDVSVLSKIFGVVVLLYTTAVSYSSYSLVYFNLPLCEIVDNQFLFFAQSAVSLIVIVYILSGFVISFRRTDSVFEKRENILFTLGIIFFLFSFIFTWQVASYFEMFVLEQYGFFGMTVFMALLAYLIVRYKAFNIKLLGAQALVISLVALIGSQFLFVQSMTAQVLTGVTLAISGWIGLMIIRSVKLIDHQKDELAKASQEKSEFMSFAAHQIRTPITVIKGYASNMLEGDYGVLPAEATKQVQKMLISANDLIYLIADYLDKAKIELNQLKYAMNPFDLKATVTKVVGDFRIGAEHHNVPVKLAIPEGVDFTISADESKIKQIVGNLIDNSIKYNVEGGHVDVSLERDEEKKTVRIIVADNGKGIAPETMPYLFLKFGRGSTAEKSSINGTGLGLYLAKEMLDHHNGSIHAESEGLGKGSKFIVELPIGEVAALEVK
jgi:signal transduction histidine kinase